MAPATGGVSLNVGNLASGNATAGFTGNSGGGFTGNASPGLAGNAGSGFTCVHSRNPASNEMMMTPTGTASGNAVNHSDQRLFSPKMRLVLELFTAKLT